VNLAVVALIVHINTLLAEGLVSEVVSLWENSFRMELLLSLSESINVSASNIDRLGHAGLSLPVGSGAHDVSWGISVEVGALASLVTTAKDAGLELCVLGLTGVVASCLVLTFHGRRCVNGLLSGILPIGS